MTRSLLSIEDLTLVLPDGRRLFDGLDLELVAGEVIAVLGGSGSGKSTLARALFERAALRELGFSVSVGREEYASELGLVPQRGALFDHLDVAGNIRVAMRQRAADGRSQRRAADAAGEPAPRSPATIEQWLAAVDLPAEWARRGTAVSRLSGGQAQRLAVARTLASGRRILFLDEPSVGLDPLRVARLARLLRRQVEQQGVAMLVVTHDVGFACRVADRLTFLDSAAGRLVEVVERWPGPLRDPFDDRDRQRRLEVDRRVTELLQAAQPPARRAVSRRLSSSSRRIARALLGAVGVPGSVLVELPAAISRQGGDAARVFGRALASGMLRPLPFYAVVSAILGYTVLYVISRAMPPGLKAARAVELVGGSYIVALTPPIGALLFVATSGSAISAWLGSMGLTRQIAALEALGISRRRYLWVPVWLALSLSFVVVAATIAGGLAAGGAWQSYQSGVVNPWPILLGDLIDPVPGRERLRARAAWLVGIYAVGIASDVVYRGTGRKERADDVTRGMTGSIVSCTLWVVLLELVTAMLVFPR